MTQMFVISKRWLKTVEACTYASLSPKTIKRMVMEGQLRGERTPGGHWRIDRDSIDEWFSGDQKAVAILRSLDV
jgi:excisionase family DNA binding protein